MSKSNWFKAHPVFTYIAVSYGITWLLWIPALIISTQHGYTLPTTSNLTAFLTQGAEDTRHLVLAICFSAAVYGPALAALLVTSLEHGRIGLARLGKRIVRWHVELKWYAAVILMTILIPAVPYVIALLTGAVTQQGAAVSPAIGAVLILLLSQLLTSGLGEEVGWRGYLLPKLQRQFKGEKVIWVAGLIWAIWHYPFVIYFNLTNLSDMPFAAALITILTALAGNTISLIGMTFIYAWIMKRTDSLILPVIFHGGVNVLMVVFAVEQITLNQPALALLVGFMPWLVALLLGKATGKDAFLPAE